MAAGVGIELPEHDATDKATRRQERREHATVYAQKDEEDAITDYNAPAHWWVVSTLFPLLAGTFGPMASAFNICALAVYWRTTIVPGNEAEGTFIRDPGWLLAANAVSLAIAIVANFALLLEMTDRISFKVGGPVTILGWYVSGFILIGLVAASPIHMPLPLETPATRSQAYYYACFAGAIYLILAFMLSWTAVGVWILHYSRGFKLTMSQRSLMLQTITFLGYILCAAGVYMRIEGWDYLDGVYFVTVTILTIGFGEYTPQTHLGRGLFFPMAASGILFVGLIIGSVRTLVLESGSVKVTTRMVEKTRRSMIRNGHLHRLHVEQGDASELEKRKQEFELMREVQKRAGRDNTRIALSISVSAFMILWLIGAVIFWQAEQALGGNKWSYFESLYFTYVALLTIGYGDFYTQTNSAKPAFVFWSLIALPTLTVLIGAVGDAISEFVDSAVLWLGNNLPESTGGLMGLKRTAQKKENREGAFQSAQPPGFMSKDNPDAGGFDDVMHAQAVQVLGGGQQTDITNQQDRDDAAAIGEAYRLYVVMKEMKNVVQHLDASPPRKYTFEEWTWFLKLIEENEATPDGHRRPGHPEHLVAEPLRSHDKQVWSWMGQESPLMSMEDEPKWVLRRLMEVVEQEVRKKADLDLQRSRGEIPDHLSDSQARAEAQ